MINPHLACELRRARRVFAKAGQPFLSNDCHVELGRMADAREPDKSEAVRLVRLAFGDPIHA